MNVPPSGLVMYTNNRSQSHGESGELLTTDETMACDVEDFVEYLNELEEKAILLNVNKGTQIEGNWIAALYRLVSSQLNTGLLLNHH